MKTSQGCHCITSKVVWGSKYAHFMARMEVQAREFFTRIFCGWDHDKAKDLAKGEVRLGSLEYALFLSAIEIACREAF